MLDKLKNEHFVIFDTETTGLMPEAGDEIVEIAAQKIKNDQIIDEFYSLIKPNVPMTEGAFLMHGYSDEFLARNGSPAQEIIPRFYDFSKEAILVGHNILSFDLSFLNIQSQKLGLPKINNLVIDTLIMSRKLLPGLPNHKLTTLADFFKIDAAGAHRAQKDVEMNKQIFLNLLKGVN